MSEYGVGMTVRRRDGAELTEPEAESIVERMMRLARAAGRCGAFEEEPDCGLGWEEEDGYTLVVTSSLAYHYATPQDIQDAGMEDDMAYAKWLATALEAELPGTYTYEVEPQEW